MKRYCCYCIRVKKNTTFNSVDEYFSANKVVSDSGSLSDIDDNNVNKNSLLSALYTENPLHQENNHCPAVVSNKNSLLPPRRNSSDDLDDNTNDNTNDNSNSSTESINNTWSWRIVK